MRINRKTSVIETILQKIEFSMKRPQVLTIIYRKNPKIYVTRIHEEREMKRKNLLIQYYIVLRQ